ncbi:chondroitin sulfate glucuronyltransferase-like [Bufo gargarizans]|uniref:chondroitin sulfate glucuronyltransferase-like n=1 Tax=Bufo gargarizans TaxID=30331 RepID=UPI001CF57485|nr:chondroitin sulfate glucuronyltransferase-like [Bufo gargarizans]
MGPRLYPFLLGLLRPALPLILGLSIGCSLSLLRVSWIQEEEAPCADNLHGLQPDERGAPIHDLKPRIIPYGHKPRAPHKKVLRTRYIQSELGFRERLSVVVLSSRSTLNSLAVAVNRTLSAHVSRLMFFTGARGPKVPSGMEVVSHGDERPVWVMYHSLRYMETHLLSTYDWFYVAQDDTFTNGFHLQDFVSHLSPGPAVYIGRPMEFIGGQEGWRYCHGVSGYLLSRALLLSLGPHLDFCRSDILSSRPDEWLGRCLQDTLGIACVAEFQGLRFVSYDLPRNADIENLDEASLGSALSVYPVREATLVYKLQRKLSQIRMRWSYRRIQRLQGEIRNLSSFTPDGGAGLLWPIGVNPPFTPTSRFDLLTWEYFTEMHTFSCPDGAPKCLLQGVWLLDVQQVLEEALDQLNQRYLPWLHFRKRRLLNGYRRFDPTRGMEYTLDLLLEATTERGHVGVITKRLSLLRPLSLVEILPMPYVTEATRVQLVLPLMPSDTSHIAGFLDAFATSLLDPQENVALTVLLVYDVSSSGQEQDVYEEVRSMLAKLEKRYPFLRLEVSSVRTELPSQVRLMEVVSKKHSVDTLFFLASVWSEVTTEALNHCRMNAIGAWQVFSPVHYQEYSPDVSRQGFSVPQSAEFLRDGHFDRLSSSECCFYNSDFMRARSRMAAEVQGEEDEDNGDIELLDLFLRHSELHVFRALEPALVQRFSLKKCSTHLSSESYHRCVLSNLEALGSRVHLAMALFDQDQTNST